MAGHHHTSKAVKIMYVVLSFILSCMMLVLSLAVILQFTLFKQDFITSSMEKVSYYELLRAEILRNLKDLGYASGIDESFFDDFLDETVIREDMTEYMTNFYSGKKTVVSTDRFKKVFNQALDEYIVKKAIKPESVSQENREYLVDKAISVYRKSVQIPFLSRLSGRFMEIKQILPITIGVSSAFSVLLMIILIFSSRWKHRSIRYICYASITVFIGMAVSFIALTATKGKRNLNISSQAVRDLFDSISNRFTMTFLYFGIFFAIVSIALFILFRYTYPKRTHSHARRDSSEVSEEDDDDD